MARKSTDLLDVFQAASRSKPAKERARKLKEPKEPKSKEPKGPRKKFEGIFLEPRQVVLAGSVGVLLLALSFVLGLGVGKSPKHAPAAGDGYALRRETATATAWAFRGEVGKIDVMRAVANSGPAIEKELGQRYRVPHDKIRVDTRGDPIVIWIGPFATKAEAQAFFDERNLQTARLGSAGPFRFARPEAVSVAR
jgi:hypothetical protein